MDIGLVHSNHLTTYYHNNNNPVVIIRAESDVKNIMRSKLPSKSHWYSNTLNRERSDEGVGGGSVSRGVDVVFAVAVREVRLMVEAVVVVVRSFLCRQSFGE